jgi:hypothetical protein
MLHCTVLGYLSSIHFLTPGFWLELQLWQQSMMFQTFGLLQE